MPLGERDVSTVSAAIKYGVSGSQENFNEKIMLKDHQFVTKSAKVNQHKDIYNTLCDIFVLDLAVM